MGLTKKLFWRVMAEAGEGNDLPGAAEPQESGEAPVDDVWGDLVADIDEYAEPSSEPDEAPAEVPAEAPAEDPVPPAPAEPPVVPELPAAPVPPPASPEEIAAAQANFRAALEQHYRFSEEDTLALQTEPEKVLPKMAARLHQEVLDMVMQQVQRTVPSMMQNMQRDSVRETQAQNEFFSAWPQLKGQDDKVIQMGRMYRQLNPHASPQEAIQQIGKLTMVALGKELTAPAQSAPVAQEPRFQPAVPGRVSSPAPAKNEWMDLINVEDD
jgi:hypothetical protein